MIVDCLPLKRSWMFDSFETMYDIRKSIANALKVDPGQLYFLHPNTNEEILDGKPINRMRVAVMMIKCSKHEPPNN